MYSYAKAPLMQISVAMCTYNGQKYLEEQLNSIAVQSLLPIELVICDDGSADDTAEIVRQFSSTAPFPVHFFKNERNLGSTKNFEKAVSLCVGELIALSDQDDVWVPEKLARLAAVLAANPSVGGVFSNAQLIDGASRPLERLLWNEVPATPRTATGTVAIDTLLRRRTRKALKPSPQDGLREHNCLWPTGLRPHAAGDYSAYGRPEDKIP